MRLLGTTQQGAVRRTAACCLLRAATENLRETRQNNVELVHQLREENPKSSPENLINTFCGAP